MHDWDTFPPHPSSSLLAAITYHFTLVFGKFHHCFLFHSDPTGISLVTLSPPTPSPSLRAMHDWDTFPPHPSSSLLAAITYHFTLVFGKFHHCFLFHSDPTGISLVTLSPPTPSPSLRAMHDWDTFPPHPSSSLLAAITYHFTLVFGKFHHCFLFHSDPTGISLVTLSPPTPSPSLRAMHDWDTFPPHPSSSLLIPPRRHYL